MAKIPVRVELASEFRYRKPLLDKDGLVIVISPVRGDGGQSGCSQGSKIKGIATLGIVNVVGSSIAREADKVFYTLAGPEISVATTKAYSTQLIAAYVLAVQFAKVRGKITEEECGAYIAELQKIRKRSRGSLRIRNGCSGFAAKQANARDIFFIGRGIDYAICMEGSLKMKEISYIHSEAYAAGELKHGTISLIEGRHPCDRRPDTAGSCMKKQSAIWWSAGAAAHILWALTTFGNYNIEDTADFTVYIPKTDPHLQLLWR